MIIGDVERTPGESPDALAARVKAVLNTHKVVHMRNVDYVGNELKAFYDDLADAIGKVHNSMEDSETGERTGERWISIHYDKRFPNRYRHAKVGQPLHTDCSYISSSPSIVFMFCENQASSGGSTTFIDSHDVIRTVEKQAPELYKQLVTMPVTFSKAADQKTLQIIHHDAIGPSMTWNYFCVDANEVDEVKELAERFKTFLEERVETHDELQEVRLAPGDAVWWHDKRVLHGRQSFEAEKNDERLLWKIAIFMDETEVQFD